MPEAKNLQGYWWYRLIKVAYIIIIVIIAISITYGSVMYFSNENDSYKSSIAEYNKQQRVMKLAEQDFELYGASLPSIDSVQTYSVRDKGFQSYYLTKQNGNGKFFINSLNHNGFHVLEPDQIEIYQRIRSYESDLGSLRILNSEPAKPQNLMVKTIATILIGFILVAIVAWLFRRVFHYVVANDRFLKI